MKARNFIQFGFGFCVLFNSALTASAQEVAEKPTDRVIATSINPDPSTYPTIYCRLYSREIAFITVLFDKYPGFRMDGCVYEPSGGFLNMNFESVTLPEDNVMAISHRVIEYPNLFHITTVTAG